jgi:hypothetical protein
VIAYPNFTALRGLNLRKISPSALKKILLNVQLHKYSAYVASVPRVEASTLDCQWLASAESLASSAARNSNP